MSQKMFAVFAGMIFLIVGLAHAVRLVWKVPVSLAGWAVPMWVSWVALVIALYLASEGFRLAKKG